MEKSTIFFSHSSLDKHFISKLREIIIKATSKTVDVFQSSDGESIPFGNNWVHKIEENLNKAKIMFVFISPKSIKSSWIYFESGFAYAKGVKVIPIGIKGIDVGQLNPPLNLLQGFNISQENGVGNIVSILNKEFCCEFEIHDEEKCHQELAKLNDCDPSNATNNKTKQSIDYVHFGFPSEFPATDTREKTTISNNPIDCLKSTLDELNIKFKPSTDNNIHIPGMVFTFTPVPKSRFRLRMKSDIDMLDKCPQIINSLFRNLYGENKIDKFWCNIVFNKNITLETVDFKASSKLHNAGIEMSDVNGKYYDYDSLMFTLSPEPIDSTPANVEVPKENLRVIFEPSSFIVDDVFNLISELSECSIIKSI